MNSTKYIGLLLPVLLSILNTAYCENQNCTEVYTENGVNKTKVFECHDGCCGSTQDRHCCEEKDDDKPNSWNWVSGVLAVFVGLFVVTISSCVVRWRMRKRMIGNQRCQGLPVTQAHNPSNQPPTYSEATKQQIYPGAQNGSEMQNNYYASNY